MRSSALLLVVATSACNGAPTLDVAVHHPAGFAVEQTVVTVYFGGDIDCTKIEFGDRTEAELAAIQVDEVDASHGGSVEVSRLGGKSIVARGFDDQRRFVTAGCQDLGEIAGSVEITIDTQPTAVVAIDPSQPDRPFGERTILVTMTDIHGTPIDGLVSWQLSGPAGAIEPVPAGGVATTAGNAEIKVDDLGTPGPEGLRIRVPWATAPLPLVTAFDLSHATTLPLGTGAFGGHPSCDVRGHAGKPPTLICLAPATDLQLHRDAIEIAWQTDHFTATPIPITAGGNNQFALFVDHDGSVDEPVYVISASPIGGAGSWYKLGAGSATPVAFGDGLESVVYAPRCKDNSTTALVGVGTSGLPSKVQFFTPAGTSISTPQAGEVFSGGCVADVDGHEHQAVVVAGLAGDAGLVLVGGNGSARPRSPAPSSPAPASSSPRTAARSRSASPARGSRLRARSCSKPCSPPRPARSSWSSAARSMPRLRLPRSSAASSTRMATPI